MKQLMEFLQERSFADFLKKAQNRDKGPLDYAADAKNPIVYPVSNSAGAKQVTRNRHGGRTMYKQLKWIVKGSALKKALKEFDAHGFAVINGQRYAIYTGPQAHQHKVYTSDSHFGVTLEELEHEPSG